MEFAKSEEVVFIIVCQSTILIYTPTLIPAISYIKTNTDSNWRQLLNLIKMSKSYRIFCNS